MNELTVFENPEFGAIRTVELDGEPWLVGKDVAAALGYSNTKDALAKHVDPEDKRQDDGVAICDPMGREQHPTIMRHSLKWESPGFIRGECQQPVFGP